MKKTDFDIFDAMSGLDDGELNRIAEKYPSADSSETDRIYRKTMQKIGAASREFSESVSGTERVTRRRWIGTVSAAAAIVLLCAAVPGAIIGLSRKSGKNNSSEQRPIIIADSTSAASSSEAMTTSPNNHYEVNIDSSSVQTSAPVQLVTNEIIAADETTAPNAHTTAPEETILICSHQLNTTEPYSETTTAATATTASSSSAKHKMTLDDVKTLSKKGYALKWSDLDGFFCDEPFSSNGILLNVYHIDKNFILRAGSEDNGKSFCYVYLETSLCAMMDIRNGGVEKFIKDSTIINDSTTYPRDEMIKSGKLSSNAPRLTYEQAAQITKYGPNYPDSETLDKYIAEFNKIHGAPDVIIDKRDSVRFCTQYIYWLDEDSLNFRKYIAVSLDTLNIVYYNGKDPCWQLAPWFREYEGGGLE